MVVRENLSLHDKKNKKNQKTGPALPKGGPKVCIWYVDIVMDVSMMVIVLFPVQF